ncbi:unnamed protein product [Protopolystoma xenopodis]|uniref:Uncharacterized protein n=1 Tax=Protopolystoma xenopodis TaxID=117903 RepID=A0A448WTP5_9PLAT|nr:unnamed protein product [Protopolystoma xenopodis]
MQVLRFQAFVQIVSWHQRLLTPSRSVDMATGMPFSRFVRSRFRASSVQSVVTITGSKPLSSDPAGLEHFATATHALTTCRFLHRLRPIYTRSRLLAVPLNRPHFNCPTSHATPKLSTGSSALLHVIGSVNAGVDVTFSSRQAGLKWV